MIQRAQLPSVNQGRSGLPPGVASGPSRREQIFSSYFNVFFPVQGDAKSSVDLWYYLASNFSAIPRKSEMLEKSLAALACAWLGKQNKDAGLLKYGVQLYNSAIKQMGSMITRDVYTDDIIYCTVLFQEIEVSGLASNDSILLFYSIRSNTLPLRHIIVQLISMHGLPTSWVPMRSLTITVIG